MHVTRLPASDTSAGANESCGMWNNYRLVRRVDLDGAVGEGREEREREESRAEKQQEGRVYLWGNK